VLLRIAVLGLAVVLMVSGCGEGDDSPPNGEPAGASATASTPEGTGQGDPSALPTRADYATGRFRTGSKPCGILGAVGRIWVSNYGDDSLVSLDPRTGRVSRPTPVGGFPCGLAYGAGSIWVENFRDFTVTRVSARTGRVQHSYDVGFSPYDVTFAAGAAWVTNNGDGTVSRIDATSGAVRTIRTGGTPTGIAPAGGLIWVGAGDAGIVAIDPASNRVVHRIDTDGRAGWTAYDEEHVWVDAGASVLRVDPATATVDQTLDVGERPADGSVLDGTLWVPDRHGLLYRFGVGGDAQGTVASTVQDPFVVTGYRGQLWVADFGGFGVVRIDPARVP
jgi:streptogramin lyase